ncbi:MAG: hypothetical protein HOK97_17650 [Deltaproteobacteria bacterium]|nr:hypothetical protein [Deltaproteobacteria bacterium]MBT6491599.1 hypothetical protein [Deltaproteobacteria bacterium]
MSNLTEAYVLGLMAEVAHKLPVVQRDLAMAEDRVAAVGSELEKAAVNHQDAARSVRDCEENSQRNQRELAESNQAIAALHQELAAIKRKIDEIQSEMDREGKGQIFRRLRRERARQLNLQDEREEKLNVIQERITEIRGELTQLDEKAAHANDSLLNTRDALESHQQALPAPALYTQVFELGLSAAHCEFFLERDGKQWCESVEESIGWMVTLHEALRAGRYQLDRNSHFVAGRSTASAEAIYGAIAVGKLELADTMFRSVTDPNLFFHEIFNVFRVWCAGLWLTGDVQRLSNLLARYEFSEGLRGGYVQAFLGLLEADTDKVSTGLKDICRHEIELWQDPSLNRGLGVVNLGAVGIARLALDAGLRVAIPGNTVPDELVAR